ncbi:hypothetical protein [Pantoea agglomerans]|uniref:hypothetical protein n=1 Tax=Enterobacter agglomerans TaxID=549 RepID=UPI0002D9BF1A|nr:hypothetical protein [Pantoea agglomerans]
MVTVSAVNEERLKKKRYQEIYQLCSICGCFTLSSFLAHENFSGRIQNERSGVYNPLAS